MKFDDFNFLKTNETYYNSALVTSLSQFLTIVDGIRALWNSTTLWYRGISKSSYSLLPSIYRDSIWKYNPEIANNYFIEFKRRSFPFINKKVTEWEAYQIMQHYGAPTRLLDWTESPLTALLFALYNLNDCQTPCVWCLDPLWLNHKVIQTNKLPSSMEDEQVKHEFKNKYNLIMQYFEKEGNELPDLPIAVLSTLMDKRIIAQKGCFTIHGKVKNGFLDLIKQNQNSRIIQIRFHDSSLKEIKEELFYSGIQYSTIYPDLEGLSKDLKFTHNMK